MTLFPTCPNSLPVLNISALPDVFVGWRSVDQQRNESAGQSEKESDNNAPIKSIKAIFWTE